MRGVEPVQSAQRPAKIAASLGKFDVAGIKLGMPIANARALLKGINPRFTTTPTITTVWPLDRNNTIAEPPPNAPKSIAQVDSQANDDAGNSETLFLLGVVHPNPPVVVYIKRVVNYPVEKGPAVESVAAGLRQKFGPPSVEEVVIRGQVVTWHWYFDEQGQLLQGNFARKVEPGCQPDSITNPGMMCASLITLLCTGAIAGTFAMPRWAEAAAPAAATSAAVPDVVGFRLGVSANQVAKALTAYSREVRMRSVQETAPNGESFVSILFAGVFGDDQAGRGDDLFRFETISTGLADHPAIQRTEEQLSARPDNPAPRDAEGRGKPVL